MKKKLTTQQKIRKLQKKADSLYHQIICKRFPKCLVCEVNDSQCAHHFVRKSQSAELRYNFSNGINICAKCHTLHHRTGDPRIHDTIIRKKGTKWADELYKIKNKVNKQYKGIEYYENIISNFERILNE